jgi:hypothetical protein
MMKPTSIIALQIGAKLRRFLGLDMAEPNLSRLGPQVAEVELPQQADYAVARALANLLR